MNLRKLFLGEYETNSPKDQFGRATPDPLIDYSKPHVSKFLVENGLKISYPSNRNFALLLSHDIDWIYLPAWSLKTLVNQQLKSVLKGDLQRFRENFSKTVRFRHSDYSLEKLVAINKRYSLRSTCFFLSLEQGEEDFNYHPSELSSDFDLLRSLNYEIGLHGGHAAFNDSSKMIREKALLEKYSQDKIVSYRNHYLKFDIGQTWACLEKAGIKVDGTYGWALVPGFRNGMAHPFLRGTVAVTPMNIMDTTLFHYRNANRDLILDVVKKMLDEVEDVNGCLSLLWHNDKLSGEMGEIYHEVIELILKRNPSVMTHKECTAWFNENKFFDRIQEGVNSLQ